MPRETKQGANSNYKYLAKIEFPSADFTLVQADSGTTFILDAIGEAITLPAASAMEIGTWFKFVIGATVATTSWTIVSAGTNDMHGQVMGGGTDDVAAGTAGGSGEDTVTFVFNNAEEGDWVHMFSDGVNWYLSGQCELAANVTVTT